VYIRQYMTVFYSTLAR